MAFKLKVAAVVRKTAMQEGFAIVPHRRLRFRPGPAVGGIGGGGKAATTMDIEVHQIAMKIGRRGRVHINLVE